MKRESVQLGKPNLHALFSVTGGGRFIIPKYQRTFAWETGNAEKLWKDINEAMTADGKNYFIGSIVVNRPEGSQNIEIIDGQQRLTTLSLLLLALFITYSEIDASKATTHILKYLKIGDIDDEYEILTLSRNNKDFYSSILKIKTLQELEIFKKQTYKEANKSNKSIFEILEFFIKAIKTSSEIDLNLEQARLNRLLKFLRENLFFIEVSVQNYSEASKVFEVLNNRGVDLTKADLIKNFLFSVAERQEALEDVEKDWSVLEDNVEPDKLEQFFRYFSLLYFDDDDIYDRVEKAINSKSAKTVSNLFSKSSETYKKFLDPSFSNDSEENKLLTELKTLGVTQHYPLLLSVYDKYPNINGAASSEVKEILKLLINFTFRYSSICGKNPNKPESIYGSLAKDVKEDKIKLNDVKIKIEELNPKDPEVKMQFLSKEFKSAQIPRYILGKIENHLSTDEKILDYDSVHLEHIMPKNIDIWKAQDPNCVAVHKKLVNNIGNMTLLSSSINTKIKNGLFENKKAEYQKSDLNTIKDIEQKTTWGEAEIEANAKRYYDFAKDIWKL